MRSSRINVITAYLDGRSATVSGNDAYGHDTPAGRGFYTMSDMSDERSKEYMKDQRSSTNMARVEGEMVGSWNLDF